MLWKQILYNIQLRSHETAAGPVYEAKWLLFKLIFCQLKMLACPWQLLSSIPHVSALKWGTLWHSTSRGIRTTKSLSWKFPKSLLLLSKVESLKLQVVAVLMPLEIKRHTVPHLKALTRRIEHRGGQGRGSTFEKPYTVLKSTTLLHKWPKRRFHVRVAVCIGLRSMICS